MDNVYCYIINLEYETEKHNKMETLVNESGMRAIFIDAIVGAKLTERDLNKYYDKSRAKLIIGRELTVGEIGCALSHLVIYEKILKSKKGYGLVLEDDTSFRFSSRDLESIVSELPSDWECVLLGHHDKFSRGTEALTSIKYRKRINDRIYVGRFVERAAGGYGYLISANGAAKRMKEFATIRYPIDYWIAGKINLYGIVPPIINIADEYVIGSRLDSERENATYEVSRFRQIKNFVIKFIIISKFIYIYLCFRKIILRRRKLKPYKQNKSK